MLAPPSGPQGLIVGSSKPGLLKETTPNEFDADKAASARVARYMMGLICMGFVVLFFDCFVF
jgi:hypothetical protein